MTGATGEWRAEPGGSMPRAVAWIEVTTTGAAVDRVEVFVDSTVADTVAARREALLRLVADNPWAAKVQRGERARDDLPIGPEIARSWARGNVRVDGSVDWQTRPISSLTSGDQVQEFDRAIALAGLAALEALEAGGI